MADEDIIKSIDDLVAEEHALRAKAPGGGLSDEERSRLHQIDQQLDQCWDLLRQRRARAEFGADTPNAAARPIDEVEGYLQ